MPDFNLCHSHGCSGHHSRQSRPSRGPGKLLLGRRKPRCECWKLFLQIPVERVEGLLLWRDPYASAKVFGAGLYMLICLRHLVCGELLLSPRRSAASRGLSAPPCLPACPAQRVKRHGIMQ